MRIGIVTFFGPYGGALQCYALQHVLNSMGHEVSVINRNWGKFCPEKGKSLISISELKHKLHGIIVTDPFAKFYKKNYFFTAPVLTEEDMVDLGTKKYFDIMIVGSDQPWNSECIKTMGYYFYLDWVSPDVRKYAYAVSYGKDYFQASKNEINDIKAILKTYQAISVRESSGVTISKELFDIDAQLCLDPTLLLSYRDYNSLIIDKKLYKDYICVFLLDPTEEKYLFVREIAEKECLHIVDNNPSVPNNRLKRYFYHKRSISQWLRNIRDSKYVITDSFHGTVFSLLFHKQFISIDNKKRGSARFESLLSAIKLSDRLQAIGACDVDILYSILIKDIEYDRVDAIINNMKLASLSFLERIK